MSLSDGVKILENDLIKAYQDAAEAGKTGDSTETLAQDVGSAIYKYMISALVTTSVVTPGGQPTAGPAVSIVSAPGTGSGTGEISFEQSDVGFLISMLVTAYNTAKKNGESGSSVNSLASDLSTAIHLFAMSAIVETNVTIMSGQIVIPYVVGPSVIPAVTMEGDGNGTGELK